MNDVDSEEDADLELLRQAALSSLLKKKKIPSTNALFYNPSANSNLISIEPVTEEYVDEDNNEEYIIAEGLSVSSSDVDEIVEEVIVSGSDVNDSSEGEDAVSVASKDSFDEILNSLEEEVKGTADGKGKVNTSKRTTDNATGNETKQTDRGSQNRRNNSSSNTSRRRHSRSPGGDKNSYSRRPTTRRISPIRFNQNRRLPNQRRRTRSPPDDRRPPRNSSYLSENNRRRGTHSPVENRRPRSRSLTTRSPLNSRRLSNSRSSTEGRRRSRSPKRRSPPYRRSRSPITFYDSRRRRSRSPYRRRLIVDNNRRRYGRPSNSRSPLKTTEMHHSSKSPPGRDAKQTKEEQYKQTLASVGLADLETSTSHRSQSPQDSARALKPESAQTSHSEKEVPRRRNIIESNKSSESRSGRRSRSRSYERSRNRRGYPTTTTTSNRRSPHPTDKMLGKRRRTPSKSPPPSKANRTRSPSPDLSNLSKEEREVFEKRKRKFQTNTTVSNLSGKIKLKSTKRKEADQEEEDAEEDMDNETDSQNSYTNVHSNNDSNVGHRIGLTSEKKSGLSSRLGDIVADEDEMEERDENPGSNSTPVDQSPDQPSSVPTFDEEESNQCTPSEDKEDLRTKLQQKRAIGIGRLFTVAIQDTLSTSTPEDGNGGKKPRRKVSATFN